MQHITREAITHRITTGASLAGARMRRNVPRGLRTLVEADTEMVRAQLGDDAAKGRLVPFVVSTEERATDGHVIRAAGWQLDAYRTNPIVLWSHSRGMPRIGDSVVEVRGDVLRAVASFLPRDVSELAWSLGETAAQRGHAASVGFGILDATPAPPEVRKTIPWALDIARAELDEWSLVNIGADAGALSERTDPERLARELESIIEGGPVTPEQKRALMRVWAAVAKKRTSVIVVTTDDDDDDEDESGEGDAVDTQEGAAVDDGTVPPPGDVQHMQCPRCGHMDEARAFAPPMPLTDPIQHAAVPPDAVRGLLTSQLVEPGPSAPEQALRGVLAGL
jgi:hypothetical protein